MLMRLNTVLFWIQLNAHSTNCTQLVVYSPTVSKTVKRKLKLKRKQNFNSNTII